MGGLSFLGAGSNKSVLVATGSADNLAVQLTGSGGSVADLGVMRRGDSIINSNSCSGIMAFGTNNNITRCSVGAGFRSAIFYSGPSGAGTVSQNEFQVGDGGTGLSVGNAVGVTVSGLTVSGNRFVGAAGGHGDGIEMGRIAGIADVPVTQITIEENRFEGLDEALHGGHSANVLVERNVMVPGTLNLHPAIEFGGTNNSVDIRNNTISPAADSNYFESGIRFSDGENSNINIVSNEITGVTKDGIGLHGHSANITVSQNKIIGADKIAIKVDASNDTHDITISRNVIAGKLNHLLTNGGILIRGGKNFSIDNNDIVDTRGGNDGNVVFGGGITMDANAVSYGTCDITSNNIKDVNLGGGTGSPPLAVIQVNTSSSFDKLKIVDNRYTGNTTGLGYFILCPDDTKVSGSLIVTGNTTNTSLPTHLGP
jgi:hypothetical protein